MGDSDFEVEVAAFGFQLQADSLDCLRLIEAFLNPRLLSTDHVNNQFFLGSD